MNATRMPMGAKFGPCPLQLRSLSRILDLRVWSRIISAPRESALRRAVPLVDLVIDPVGASPMMLESRHNQAYQWYFSIKNIKSFVRIAIDNSDSEKIRRIPNIVVQLLSSIVGINWRKIFLNALSLTGYLV